MNRYKDSEIFEPAEFTKPANKRDPNWSPVVSNGRPPSARKPTTTSSLSNDMTSNDVAIAKSYGRRQFANAPSFEFGQGEEVTLASKSNKRDPNARSAAALTDAVTGSRPSSRVLNNPGGRSTITLG